LIHALGLVTAQELLMQGSQNQVPVAFTAVTVKEMKRNIRLDIIIMMVVVICCLWIK
jgi:hypothetical protein